MANPRGIPRTETIWETYTTSKGDIYYVTTKSNSREYYFLYKLTDGAAEKLGKARNPIDLKEKYLKD